MGAGSMLLFFKCFVELPDFIPGTWALTLFIFYLLQGQNMGFVTVFKGTRDVSQKPEAVSFPHWLSGVWPSTISLAGLPTSLLMEISQEILGCFLLIPSWEAGIKSNWTCIQLQEPSDAPREGAASSVFVWDIREENRQGEAVNSSDMLIRRHN